MLPEPKGSWETLLGSDALGGPLGLSVWPAATEEQRHIWMLPSRDLGLQSGRQTPKVNKIIANGTGV